MSSINLTISKISYFGFTILLMGSGFYLAGITPYSPVYLAFLIGLFVLSIRSTLTKLPIDNIILLNFIFFVLIMSVQLSISDFKRPFVSFLCHLYFILIYIIGSFLPYQKLRKSVIISLYFVFLLLTVEAVLRIKDNLRLNFNFLSNFEDNLFYNIKYDSIMFMDSNHVAMVILPFYFLALVLRKEFKVRTDIFLIGFFVLLIFTYSRAAILSAIIFTLLFYFFGVSRKIFKLISVIALPTFLTLYYLYPLIRDDPSLASKFMIFNKVIEYTNSNGIETLFFGIGYGNSARLLNIGTHNIFLTYYVEGGILSIIFVSILYYQFIKKSEKTLYIILPFLLAGLSFAPQVQTFYFSSIAVVILLDKKYQALSNANKYSLCKLPSQPSP